nr:HNH endonuclease signature motif containing protein [Candidatus Njordarchaeota archaeon]
MEKSVAELVMEYFKAHPRQDLEHGPVVDWVELQYRRLYKKKPRDTWRAIRKLYQEGKLIKVKKGVYRYDPDLVRAEELFDFPEDVKEAIFKRDSYKCVVCGLGRKDGVEICADHIVPKDKGGTNTIENGQTLCAQHNLIKKNYSQTEAGKRYFIKMYEQAIKSNDAKMIEFCKQVFDAYNRHGVNAHILRPDK